MNFQRPGPEKQYSYIKKYIRSLTFNILDKDDRTQLRVRANDDTIITVFLFRFKRTLLIDANCAAGVKSCIGNMTKMFRQWMEDPVNNP